MLTPLEVAERLRVDRETVYRHIRAGILPAARIGHSYRIDSAALDDFIAAAGRSRVVSSDDPHPAAAAPARRATDPTPAPSSRLTPGQRASAIQLLAEWRAAADNPEHGESWELLKHALDEGRLSSRRLFD